MKSVRNGPPPKRSLNLKSADEDMKDYLAQEEPDAAAPAVTRDDSHQGIDAERARKPERESDLATESGPVRTPIVMPENRSSGAPSMNPSQQRRLQRVDACLTYYLTNPETTTARSPWAVMHALLPFGADYELAGPSGRVNAIGWMCHNGLCRTQRIFTPRGNSFVPNVGGGVQGHQGQFLAILAQCQVPLNYPIQIGSRQYQVEDLVRYEMATCRERTELTFKLIGLSYYVDANKQWRSNDGKVWNLAKLLQEELAQPIVGSACGGTHRLMGYSFALKQRSLQGQPITGVYAKAARFVEENVQYTWRLQNPDGSFSTQWYEGRGNDPNDERKVQTSGHMLEWLMFTIPDSELDSPRVERAVDFLLQKIYDQRENKWPIGPRGHATRALALYSSRLANSAATPSSSEEAGGSTRTAMREPAPSEVRLPDVRVPAPQGGASVKSPANPPPSGPRNSPSNRPTSRTNRRFRG
jgi:hypothetical protein